MEHIEKSAFRRGEYTALAGTAETLARYRIFRTGGGWHATSGNSRDGTYRHFDANTLRDLDARFQEISQ